MTWIQNDKMLACQASQQGEPVVWQNMKYHKTLPQKPCFGVGFIPFPKPHSRYKKIIPARDPKQCGEVKGHRTKCHENGEVHEEDEDDKDGDQNDEDVVGDVVVDGGAGNI